MISALFIGYNLKIFEKKSKSIKELFKFSVEVTFEQFNTIDVENKYDCNAKSLKVCDINDPTTLFGCKELSVRCQHFENNTEFKENGKTYNIPKNKYETEGYALSIVNIVGACNPYHGDLVLVTANADSNDYMLICSCKNPGFIGNTSLLNSCEDIFICNGEIDDLNKPLEQINCKCGPTEKSVRYNSGVPTCKPLLVYEANEMYEDWSPYIQWLSDRKIQVNVFNNTIQKNLKTSILLNPCTSSIHDLSVEIPNSQYSSVTKTCHYHDYGLPLRTGLLDEPNKHARVDGGLVTGAYDSIRLSGGNSGQAMFGALRASMNFVPDNEPSILHDMIIPRDITVGISTSQLRITTYREHNPFGWPSPAWGPQCLTRPSFKWNCYIKQNTKWEYYGLPRLGYAELNSAWSQHDLWNTAYTLYNDSFWINNNGIHVNNQRLNDVHNIGITTHGYGIKISGGPDTGLLAFSHEEDWRAHYNTIT